MAPPVIVVPTTPIVVLPKAGPGGGGGGGSTASMASIAISSSPSSVGATSTTIQGLLLNSIGKTATNSPSPITNKDILTSIKVVAEIYSTNIQKNIENYQILN